MMNQARTKQRQWWNSMEKWKKSLNKFERIWEIFDLDLREWIVNVNSVTIKNIYDVLINLVKHD
jgi:succinate dehydrogenase flavin-adding protein (antitoxin of CptAB toxin-antitoxin module)